MAISNNQPAKNQERDTRPDGYLNMRIIDSEGKAHSLPGNASVALRQGNQVAESLLKAAKENPEKEFTLVATVHVVDKDAPAPTF